MQNFLRLVFPLILLSSSGVAVFSAADLTDPYQVLNQHYSAIGGLDNLKAAQTQYFEADFSLVGTGLEGTVRQWSRSPVQQRQELDLTVIKQTSGDNGEVAWVVDTNGKLKVMRDEETVKQRKINGLMAQYEHLDPGSEIFCVSLEAGEEVEGEDCYRIRISNSLDSSEWVYLISKETLLMKKSIMYSPDGGQMHNSFSDYREVDGVLYAFKQNMKTVPTHQVQELTMTRLETNLEIDDSLFDPPAEEGEDFAFANGSSSENIQFLFHENHIYLEVTVNCDKQLWIFDSGAGMTVIDKDYAAELGLAFEGSMTGQGAHNTVDYTFVTIPGLQVEGITIDQQRAIAIDLAHLFNQLSDLKVAGILGYDFLSRFVSRIDYANERISFYHPDTFEYVGSGRVIDAPLNAQNMFGIPMTVEGGMEGVWRLDTGASGSSFHFHFAEENGLLNRPGTERQSFGAGGSNVSRVAEFSGAEVAGFDLPPLQISIPSNAGHGAMAEREKKGQVSSYSQN